MFLVQDKMYVTVVLFIWKKRTHNVKTINENSTIAQLKPPINRLSQPSKFDIPDWFFWRSQINDYYFINFKRLFFAKGNFITNNFIFTKYYNIKIGKWLLQIEMHYKICWIALLWIIANGRHNVSVRIIMLMSCWEKINLIQICHKWFN